MRRLGRSPTQLGAIFLAVLLLCGCQPMADTRPGERIVSIDYCADQALLGFVEPARIAGVSREIDSDGAFAGAWAGGLPRVRASAEDILALRPTLVVRSYAGGPRLDAVLRAAGIRIFTLPYAANIADVEATIEAAGRQLNARSRANRRRDEWRQSLLRASQAAKASRVDRQPRALYMTPGDVTTGPDNFIAGLLTQAGFSVFDRRPGWNRLPLEEMAQSPPDVIVRAFFDSPAYQQDRWSSARHVVARRTVSNSSVINLTGGDIACGNWRTAIALDRLTAARLEFSK